MNAPMSSSHFDLWIIAGWTMIHFLWLGTLVALVALVSRWLLRRASANVRYAVALTCLAMLAALPVAIAIWLQENSPPLQGGARGGFVGVNTQVHDSTFPEIAPVDLAALRPSENSETRISAVSPQVVTRASKLVASPIHAPIASDPFALASSTLNTSIRYLPWLWLIGTPITFALTATGLIGTRRLRLGSRPITDGPIAEALEKLAASLRLTRRVAVAVCDRIASPVLIGILRPIILLPPAALTGYSPDEIEMVLLHELAHVRRWDNLMNLLQRLVESLLFFHPAVWLLSSWVRREREACCDALVVTRTDRPHAYAELLVALAAQMPRSVLFHPAASSAMAAGPLHSRIRRILKLDDDPMLISGKSFAAVLAALLLAATFAVLYLPKIGQAEQPATQITKNTESTQEKANAEPDNASKVEPESVPLSFALKRGKLGQTEIYLNEQLIDEDAIRALLRGRKKSSYDLPISVTADKFIDYADVMKVIDLLESLGVKKLALDTRSCDASESHFKSLFEERDDNPIETRTHQVHPSIRKTMPATFEGWQKDPYGPQLKFGAKWSADHSTVEITAPQDAQIKFAQLLATGESTSSPSLRATNSDQENRQLEIANSSDYKLIRRFPGDMSTKELIKEIDGLIESGQLKEKRILIAYPPQASGGFEWSIRDAMRDRLKAGKLADISSAWILGDKIELLVSTPSKEAEPTKNAASKAKIAHGEPKYNSDSWAAGAIFPSPKEGEISVTAFRTLGIKVVQATKDEERDEIGSALKVVGGILVPPESSSPIFLHSLNGIETKTFDGLEKALKTITGRSTVIAKSMTRVKSKPVWIESALEASGNPSRETLTFSAKSPANATAKASPKFPSLEDQRLADLAYKRLQLEIEQISETDLKRVKAFGYEGGVKVTSVSNPSDRAFQYNEVQPDDILVGLHVWPTTSLQNVANVLSRDDLQELNPLKFYVIRPGRSQEGGFASGPKDDTVITGRISLKEVQPSAPTQSDPFKPKPHAATSADDPKMEYLSNLVEMAHLAKMQALTKGQQATGDQEVEAAKRELERADRQLEDAKRQLEKAQRAVEDKSQRASEKLEAAMKAKQEAIAKRQQAKDRDAVEAAKRELEKADRQLEDAKRSLEKEIHSAETAQNTVQPTPATKPRPPVAGEAPRDAAAQPANSEELDILREQVKIADEQFKQNDDLYKKGAKGGSKDRVEIAAYELALAQADLALAEGKRDEALAKLIDARAHAEEAYKAVAGAYEAGRVSYDLLRNEAKNLSEIKLKVARLQTAKPQPISPLNNLPFVGRLFVNQSAAPTPTTPKTSPAPATTDEPKAPYNYITVEPSPTAAPTAKPELLRYDGKTFNEWQTAWRTELSTDKRLEAVKALAAFGANGYGKEAADAIIEVAGQYDWKTIGDNKAVEPLQNACEEAFGSFGTDENGTVALNIPAKDALPALSTAAKSGNTRQKLFLTWVLPYYLPSPESVGLLLSLSKDKDATVRKYALQRLPNSGIEGYEEKLSARIREALKSNDPEEVVAAMGASFPYRDKSGAHAPYPYLAEYSKWLFSAHEAVRKQARNLASSLQGDDATNIAATALAILKDNSKKEQHLEAIRALAALGPNAKSAVETLRPLVKSDDQSLAIAATLALRHILKQSEYSKLLYEELGQRFNLGFSGEALQHPGGKKEEFNAFERAVQDEEMQLFLR